MTLFQTSFHSNRTDYVVTTDWNYINTSQDATKARGMRSKIEEYNKL